MQQTSISFNVPTRLFQAAAVAVIAAVSLMAGLIISSTGAGAQSGTVVDTAYTAVTPCASFDSRTDTGALAGQYTHLESRTFQITGTAPADQQAGVDCGVPAGADAVLVNIVAIQPATGGNLRAFATGDTGTGGVVNYSPVSPNLNNSNAVVIPLNASGQIDVQNNCGGCGGTSVHARGVVLGYFTDDLAQQVQLLFDAFDPDGDGVLNVSSPDASTIRFEGTNVQIVDGSGDTSCSGAGCNGQGNLIVGYNEDVYTFDGTDVRTGTHSVIIGEEHTWTSYGHLIAGRDNTATGPNSSVTGGRGNTAFGSTSAVVGGRDNTASGQTSSVSGGFSNTASAANTSVAGGYGNAANGNQSTVSGGQENVAIGASSSVSGGRDNEAIGFFSAVSGGFDNDATGESSSVAGGLSNQASGLVSSVVGGQ